MFEGVAATLLEKFGADLTLTRAGTPTYNPATGDVTADADTAFTIRGVFVAYRDEHIDGTLIQSGDRKLLVSADGSETAPQKGDVVDGMSLINVRTFAPNGIAVAWSCQARA